MKRIICKVIERAFPAEIKRMNETNRAKRDAIQAMLNACRQLRDEGKTREQINSDMRTALRRYDAGKFKKFSLVLPV